MAKPFIKWAGGKGQLINDIRKLYPAELGKRINKYCEPFVGGGAVLFDVLSNYNLKQVLINDINRELIVTYKAIKENINELIKLLKQLQEDYCIADATARKQIYTELRNRFNSKNSLTDIETAALFIFLNKTCFNGLYRVNSKGLFNVPMGNYKKPAICDEKNLLEANKVLKNIEIICGDYSACENFIDSSTFVYIDPPYKPLTKTANFTSYTGDGFDDAKQVELSNFCKHIRDKGATLLISNSDPQNNDSSDMFFDDLYSTFDIKRVMAKRYINCDASSRGNINELLISSKVN